MSMKEAFDTFFEEMTQNYLKKRGVPPRQIGARANRRRKRTPRVFTRRRGHLEAGGRAAMHGGKAQAPTICKSGPWGMTRPRKNQ